jgi:hypothetical protein
VPLLPDAPFAAVLGRLDATWSPWTAPHLFILAMSGAGKTTLIRQVLGYACAPERVLVLDPKPADDPVLVRRRVGAGAHHYRAAAVR